MFSRQRDGKITILSKCTDTTRVQNGVLCSMHPSEGFWLFKVLAPQFADFSSVSVLTTKRGVLAVQGTDSSVC